MGIETVHVVQQFAVNEWGEFGGRDAKVFKSADQARACAERSREAGYPAVAFSRSGDPKIGEYGPPTILGRFGDIPDDVIESFCGGDAGI